MKKRESKSNTGTFGKWRPRNDSQISKCFLDKKKIESNVRLFFYYSIHSYFKRLCNGSESQKYFSNNPSRLYKWTVLFEIAKCFCIEETLTDNLDATLFLSYIGNVLFFYFVKMIYEDIYMRTFTIFFIFLRQWFIFRCRQNNWFCLVISLYTAIWTEISYVYRPRILHNKNKKKREKNLEKNGSGRRRKNDEECER